MQHYSDQNQLCHSPERVNSYNLPSFITPTKPQWTDFSQNTNKPDIINLFTPPQKITHNSIGQYSTQSHTSPFQGSIHQSPWKTPKSVLKSQHSENQTPLSPFTDRYIPFRPQGVSRNLFCVQEEPQNQKNIHPFYEEIDSSQPMEIEEDENKRTYQQVLQKNMISNSQVLNFKPKSNQNQITQFEEAKFHNTPTKRKIESQPYKVLDAPGLEDDYYQDTLHWSKSNIIAVGLQKAVFLYNVNTSKVHKVAESKFVTEMPDQAYHTSVQWNTTGQYLALGTYNGEMLIYDQAKQSYIRNQKICQKRIATISWANSNIFACGSKDKSLAIGDLRSPNLLVEKLAQGHTQEVCGVTIAENEYSLASGGNDNKVIIWDMRTLQTQWIIKEHKAAVRALAWNPHASGVLATGGGNSDKTIKIFSSLTNTEIQTLNVDSQVCKLRFAKTVNELVSTHGYEHNHITLWSYPQMKKIISLDGHQNRVLYLSVSPDETTLVTGSGDETIKFWNAFPPYQHVKDKKSFQITDIR